MGATRERLATGWDDDAPDGDNLFLAFVRNQAEVAATIAVACGGRAADRDGVALSDSGGPVAYFNQAVLQRPLTGPDDPALDEVDAFWAGASDRASVLFSVWPTPDLSGRGWSLVGHPALVVRSPGPHDGATPRDVEVEVVRSVDALAEAERVVVDGYPIPEAAGSPAGGLLRPELLRTGVRYRVARLDGRAVAAAAQFTGHGVVNLCLAATLPAARRRGAWGALVWSRVDDHPDLPAMAFTSDLSRPGFEHLGFLVLTRCTLWTRG